MKLLLVISFVVLGQCSPPVILFRERSPGKFYPELVTGLIKLQIKNEDVKFYFRNRDDSSSTVPLDTTDTSSIFGARFSIEKDTVFVIHGWNNEYDSPMNKEVTDAILKAKDANVFEIDWSALAKQFYNIAASAVPEVANVSAQLIKGLVKTNGLDLERTFIVGHSLGAHVAGIIGADLNGKVNHIVGLDPALPLFWGVGIDKCLDSSDAQFVEIIHTSAGLLGFNEALGHVDYWPNGGSNQPGCGFMDITGACSHGRAFSYYAESLISGGFSAFRCDSDEDCKTKNYNRMVTSYMGHYNIDKNAHGSFYLETKSSSPYSL